MNVYSSTRFSGSVFEHEMICIPRTARYVVRNQAETARYVVRNQAETEDRYRKHERTSTYTAVRDVPVLPSFCRV